MGAHDQPDENEEFEDEEGVGEAQGYKFDDAEDEDDVDLPGSFKPMAF